MANENLTPALSAERLLAAQVGVIEMEADLIERRVRSLYEESNYSRQASITGVVGGDISASVYQCLDQWMWNDRSLAVKSPYQINMNSGAGSHIHAFAVFDTIRMAQEAGFDVVLQATGVMDTTPAMLMQAAKKRVMTPRSWLTISEINIQTAGNTNAHKDQVKFARQREEHCWRLLTSRTDGKLTMEMLKDKTYRGARWWISADEAKELGLIDEVSTTIATGKSWCKDDSLLPQDGDSWLVRKRKSLLRKALAETELHNLARGNDLNSMADSGKIALFDEVSPISCALAADALYKQKRRGNHDVDLLVNSPGGCVFSGSGLMDVLETVKSDGRGVDTTIIGMAASMGGFISQTGRNRRITKNSYFMIHQVSSMFGGSSSHAEDQAESMERLQEDLFGYMADRTGGKLSIEELKKKCSEHDWWLTPTEALEVGLVDTII